MSKNIALGIVIGGAVASTLGRSVSDAKGKITGLKSEAGKLRLFQKAIGDTQKLQTEIARVGKAGGNIDALNRKLDANTAKLRRAGIEVAHLDAAYGRLGKRARSLELKAMAHNQMGKSIEAGKSAAGTAAAVTAIVTGPAMESAKFKAIMRDLAIKEGIGGTREEFKITQDVIAATKDEKGKQFIGLDEMADLVNVMVGAGMELKKAVELGHVAGVFKVGQGASAEDTAKLIFAFQSQAKIPDKEGIEKGLNIVSKSGKKGSFEAKDMAKWMPIFLALAGSLHHYGLDAIASHAALAQADMKVATSADEAGNNMSNLYSKITAGETADHYNKITGRDYQNDMKKAMNSGESPIEAFVGLLMKYMERAKPEQAKLMQDTMESINKETDKQKKNKMMGSLAEQMDFGDIINDRQAKMGFLGWYQNRGFYKDIKEQSLSSDGEIDKDLTARRDTSLQKWTEAGQALEATMIKIGSAIEPVTNRAADISAGVAKKTGDLADASPLGVAAGVGAAGWLGVKAGGYALKSATTWLRSLIVGEAPKAAPKAGLGLVPKMKSVIGRGVGATMAAGNALAMGGNAALAAPTAGAAIAGTGAAGAAAAGLMIAGAGAAGYGVGSLVAKGIDKGLSGVRGSETSLGSAIYDLTHRKPEPAQPRPGEIRPVRGPEPARPRPGELRPVRGLVEPTQPRPGELRPVRGLVEPAQPRPGELRPVRGLESAQPRGGDLNQIGRTLDRLGMAIEGLKDRRQEQQSQNPPVVRLDPKDQKPAVTNVKQDVKFAPALSITVKGDVKDPAKLAAEIMPHLRKLFGDFQAGQQRAALHDAAHI